MRWIYSLASSIISFISKLTKLRSQNNMNRCMFNIMADPLQTVFSAVSPHFEYVVVASPKRASLRGGKRGRPKKKSEPGNIQESTESSEAVSPVVQGKAAPNETTQNYDEPERFYRVREAIRIYKITKTKIYDLMHQKILPYTQLFGIRHLAKTDLDSLMLRFKKAEDSDNSSSTSPNPKTSTEDKHGNYE
jgi:predicted DNA-binding transcriptional regulator AlpA